MPRRGNIAKRDVLADPIYNSKMVTRLVNSVMLDGKKGVAQKIVYEAFSMIQEKTATILWRLSRRRWRTSCPASSARPACGWRKLSGPPGSQPRSPRDSGSALADRLQPQPW